MGTKRDKFEIDGKRVSADEYQRLKIERKSDKVEDAWMREMAPRGIRFAGEMPKLVSAPATLVCTCLRQRKFTCHLAALAVLPMKDPYCTQCYRMRAATRFEVTVANKVGTAAPYMKGNQPVKITCAEGHEFERTPNYVRKGGWCPECARIERSNQTLKVNPRTGKPGGEARLREAMAERGMELIEYMPDVPGYGTTRRRVSLFGGTPVIKQHSYLTAQPPTYKHKGKTKVRVFYDEENGFSYILLGKVPPSLPAFIADIVKRWDFELQGELEEKKYAYDELRRLIRHDNDRAVSDYHCVNVLHNDAWVAPGVYDWGTIPTFDGTLVDMGDLVGK